MTTHPTPTITRIEAEQALGIKSRSAFHYLKSRYPQAFVVIKQGTDRSNPTLYDRAALDKFIQWRKLSKEFSGKANAPESPLALRSPPGNLFGSGKSKYPLSRFHCPLT